MQCLASADQLKAKPQGTAELISNLINEPLRVAGEGDVTTVTNRSITLGVWRNSWDYWRCLSMLATQLVDETGRSRLRWIKCGGR